MNQEGDCDAIFHIVPAELPDCKKSFWMLSSQGGFFCFTYINLSILYNFIRNQVSSVWLDLIGKSGVIPALSRNCEGESYFCKPLTKEKYDNDPKSGYCLVFASTACDGRVWD